MNFNESSRLGNCHIVCLSFVVWTCQVFPLFYCTSAVPRTSLNMFLIWGQRILCHTTQKKLFRMREKLGRRIEERRKKGGETRGGWERGGEEIQGLWMGEELSVHDLRMPHTMQLYDFLLKSFYINLPRIFLLIQLMIGPSSLFILPLRKQVHLYFTLYETLHTHLTTRGCCIPIP